MPHSPPADHVAITTRIRGLLPDLRAAERRVADAVLENPAEVARETITALAERCRTSAPTVVRFARRLGFSGYPQLRLALAKEAGIEEGRQHRAHLSGTLDPTDTVEDTVAKISAASVQAIEDTATTLDVESLERAADALVRARRIDLLGVGGSAVAAIDLSQKLSRLGLLVTLLPERHAAMTAVSLRGERDVVICVSHSGATTDVVLPMELAAERGVTTIAVTNHPTSKLAVLADIALITASHETTFRSGAMASRIAQLMAVDCIFAGVALRDMDSTRAALDASFRAVADF